MSKFVPFFTDTKVAKNVFDNDPTAVEWLKTLLREREVRVTFLKKDGSERVMVCTLKEGVVVPHQNTSGTVKKHSDEVLPVWDVEVNEWRSFRLDSILTVEFDIGETTE